MAERARGAGGFREAFWHAWRRHPADATPLLASKPIADVAQLVEHQLPKLRVASSSLVVRFDLAGIAAIGRRRLERSDAR